MTEVELRPTIRAATRADVPEIKAVETELNLSPWSERDYVCELERGDSVFLVYAEERSINGFLLARLITNTKSGIAPFSITDTHPFTTEIEIFNIGIRTAKQRHGYASRLLTALLRETRDKSPGHILLDVRKQNNNAILFYERHKFYAIGLRKQFYTNPPDDSIVMRRDLLIQHNTIT